MAGFRDVFPIDFQGKVAVSTCYLVHYHVDDGLRESYGVARQFHQRVVHGFYQSGLVASRGPGVVWLQSDAAFHVREGEGFGPFIVASHLRHDVGHFGESAQHLSQLGSHLLGTFYGDARRQLHLNPDGPLVQRRKEVFPYRITQYARQQQDACQYANHGFGTVDDANHLCMIQRLQLLQPTIVVRLARLAVSHIGKSRNQYQSHAQSTYQRIAYGIGHRREQFLFDMLEGKQRQVGGDNDKGGEEDGTCHLRSASQDGVLGQHLVGMPFAFLQDGLHHHDGTVHQDTEVDGTQRKQIGRNIGDVHQDKGYQQGEGNGECHQQSAAPVAQEENQYEHYQHHTHK